MVLNVPKRAVPDKKANTPLKSKHKDHDIRQRDTGWDGLSRPMPGEYTPPFSNNMLHS